MSETGNFPHPTTPLTGAPAGATPKGEAKWIADGWTSENVRELADTIISNAAQIVEMLEKAASADTSLLGRWKRHLKEMEGVEVELGEVSGKVAAFVNLLAAILNANEADVSSAEKMRVAGLFTEMEGKLSDLFRNILQTLEKGKTARNNFYGVPVCGNGAAHAKV